MNDEKKPQTTTEEQAETNETEKEASPRVRSRRLATAVRAGMGGTSGSEPSSGGGASTWSCR